MRLCRFPFVWISYSETVGDPDFIPLNRKSVVGILHTYGWDFNFEHNVCLRDPMLNQSDFTKIRRFAMAVKRSTLGLSLWYIMKLIFGKSGYMKKYVRERSNSVSNMGLPKFESWNACWMLNSLTYLVSVGQLELCSPRIYRAKMQSFH